MEYKKLITFRKTGYLIVISLFLVSIFINNSFAKGGQSLGAAIKHQLADRYPEAITEYYEIIEKDPQNLNAYYNLAFIIEVVLEDYESAISLYDKALSIAENKKIFTQFNETGLDNEDIEEMIVKIKTKKEDLIQKIFNAIEGVTFPRYIVLKNGKGISDKPFSSKNKKKSKTLTKNQNGFRFMYIRNNWYQVLTANGKPGWVKGEDIRLIYYNSNEKTMLAYNKKIEKYINFVNIFPVHKLTSEAKERMTGLQ